MQLLLPQQVVMMVVDVVVDVVVVVVVVPCGVVLDLYVVDHLSLIDIPYYFCPYCYFPIFQR